MGGGGCFVAFFFFVCFLNVDFFRTAKMYIFRLISSSILEASLDLPVTMHCFFVYFSSVYEGIVLLPCFSLVRRQAGSCFVIHCSVKLILC